MLDSLRILKCYENVLIRDLQEYNVPLDAVKIGIESMSQVYKPDTADLNCDRPIVADFNDLAHRCAYLHKYAAFHTAMVKDLLFEAIVQNFDFFKEWVYSQNNFKICSLGGGPGSDVIGSLAALGGAFGYFPASAVIVDYMVNWRHSFYSVLRELNNDWYDPFGRNISYLNWCYVGANLLKPLTHEVIDSLSEASLVTMIKFASAAACQDTETMMRKIFASLKPGAMVLFIDNDGGGFHQLVFDAAKRYNFFSVYGPHRHKNYSNELMKLKKFGYVSCFKSTVTIHILQKPYQMMPYSDYFVNPNRRVIINTPSHLANPPTPILFCADDDFTKDETIEHKEFTTPEPDISQTADANTSFARNVAFESTPLVRRNTTRIRKNRMQGCFPVKNFRHHLANKMNKIKAAFRKKKNHPIYKL